MTKLIPHPDIAHRFIDSLIDNAPDELHDRARDDIADALDPHLDNLRALCYSLHDATCTEMHIPYPADDDDYIFDIACDLDNSQTAKCIAPISDALYNLLYHSDFNID